MIAGFLRGNEGGMSLEWRVPIWNEEGEETK